MTQGIVILAVILIAGPAIAQRATIGQPAPDFTGTTMDGRQVTLADFRGQVVVVNLWATWCVPCRAEMPLLEAYCRVQAKNGLRIIAFSTEHSLPPQKLEALSEHLTLSMMRRFDGGYPRAERHADKLRAGAFRRGAAGSDAHTQIIGLSGRSRLLL